MTSSGWTEKWCHWVNHIIEWRHYEGLQFLISMENCSNLKVNNLPGATFLYILCLFGKSHSTILYVSTWARKSPSPKCKAWTGPKTQKYSGPTLPYFVLLSWIWGKQNKKAHGNIYREFLEMRRTQVLVRGVRHVPILIRWVIVTTITKSKQDCILFWGQFWRLFFLSG
jgi:hypothetical protein